MLKTYFKNLTDVAARGDETEQSYYPALKELLEEYAESAGKNNIHITPLPKKTEAGNPDFRIWDGKQHITGYIESKPPSVEDLDKIERSEQLIRYRKTFPNLILTNFFEFRLYKNGELVDKVVTGRPYVLNQLKKTPPIEKEKEFDALLDKFFSFSLPQVRDAKTLARELAHRTRFLRDAVIAEELAEQEKNGKAELYGFYQAFQQYLISGLSKEDFADIYSQTITYGLFAARTRAPKDFSRRTAFDSIPRTIGILREVFRFISLGENLSKQMEWIIDDIAEVLAVTDVHKILHEYFHKGKGKDPIVHFYETFLAEYDPKTREKRGVYYTPEPVVSYIVRSLNIILKEKFGRKDGFADASVTVLDPAAGTLTFLAEAAKLAVEEAVEKHGEGIKQKLIKDQILKNFYAFELMMAPYAIGHLKMSFLLEELGYRLHDDDRFKLYLTNTLDMEELHKTALPGMAALSEESHLAGKVKKEQPILVIMGNPPYSGHSSNVGEWILKEIKAYHEVDGKPLGEKNPKWLQDDYVKFIRFAQWKIDKAGEGVVGLITNHSYLDNPTFRGMRQSLMNSFDEIYILDLHGNSLKKEKCPDGSKDENVFDIMQGVAIVLFIKKTPLSSPLIKGGNKGGCKVSHAETWGMREQKYEWLQENDINSTTWHELSPKSEFYFFIPRDERLSAQYEKFWKITDIFPVNSVGIVTARDSFVIDRDREVLKRRIRMFCDPKMLDDIISQTFGLKDSAYLKLSDARQEVRKDENWEDKIIKILYRPFDTQWIFYHDTLIERSRKEVMRHMMKENLGLVTVRQVAEGTFDHAYCTENVVESRITLSNKGIAYLFPLYLYEQKPKPKKRMLTGSFVLFEPAAEYLIKKSNLSLALVEQLTKAYKHSPLLNPHTSKREGGWEVSPEQVFYYIYGVLYSNTYRTKYAEFLKIDFPRIPFTADFKLFTKMAEYGKILTELHLLKSNLLDKPIAKFQGSGNYHVEKISYEKGRVYINAAQYFEGVPDEVRQYQVGGYQVCGKWLKDRKGRALSFEEIKRYCAIVTALANTIEIQKQIDAVYSGMEKELIK